MANTVGTPGYIGQVQKMDTSTPAYGPTFDAIHQQLLNNDAFLNSEILSSIQDAINSGVEKFASLSMLSTTPNAFILTKEVAFINGIRNLISNYGGKTDGTNLITIDPPPTSNVTPSLTGSARDDLVFLEMWLDATTGAPKWRIRVVDGVDFGTYPEGLSYSSQAPVNVTAQGANSAPLDGTIANRATNQFAPLYIRQSLTSSTGAIATDDNGLYVAGRGDAGSKSTLATIDGYVYAIPLFRVRRRNNAGFDPDYNPLGARDYIAFGLTNNPAWTSGGQTVQFTASGPGITGLYVGAIIGNGSTAYLKVVSIDSATQFTATTLQAPYSGWTPTNYLSFNIISDRPDGLYSNIIDASDITDLRHQVSLTGFNNQALLEKNLDLLLRGQLTTNAGARYSREYIGLNVAAGMPDDANTLLKVNFDGGTINGTANGTAVNGTIMQGPLAFANGVQGQAFAGAAGTVLTYPISIPNLLATNLTVEMFFNPSWDMKDTGYHSLLCFRDSSNIKVAELYYASLGNVFNFNGTFSGFASGTNFTVYKNQWNYLKATISTSGVITLQINDSTVTGTISGSVNAITSVNLGGNAAGSVASQANIDSVRISNIVRTGTPLPANFSYANGDKILDGPNGDFAQWSDDLGGIAGVNGRSNPYGLSRVPNAVAARVSVNGSEIRHYYGAGLTPGWLYTNYGGTSPTGSADNSAEYQNITSNEAADGTKTVFTFNLPSTSGLFLLKTFASIVTANSNYVPCSGLSLSNGVLSATLSTAPSAGQTVQIQYTNGARHAHFIPSTKGFIIHDQTDDALTADGNTKVFWTSKYNVTSHNHVRVTASGSTAQTIQNGGYSTGGINANTTITASASSGATTITVASTTGLIAGQPIRINKGDGTWYTTTISSISGNTLTIPALTVNLSQNAVLQGAGFVTFTTAPAAGTVDLVYESVYTPALGDYIRVMYQHTPYQGTGTGGDKYSITHVDWNVRMVTRGTGKVPSARPTTGEQGVTTRLPLPYGVYDYFMKDDNIVPTAVSAISSYAGLGTDGQDYAVAPALIRSAIDADGANGASGMAGTQFLLSNYVVSLPIPVRGYNSLLTTVGNSASSAVQASDLPNAIPHLSIWAMLGVDQNGVVRLVIATSYQNNRISAVSTNPYDTVAIDTFHIQGRPLIKNYGGVTA